MDVFRHLNQKASQENLKFLVIGGHAINAHGITRNTMDLDLLVARKDLQDIIELVILGKIDPNTEQFKKFCLTYIRKDEYEEICQACDRRKT